MTEAEALQYAIDWLRAFPVLPCSAPGLREERAACVARLDVLRKRCEQDVRAPAEAESYGYDNGFRAGLRASEERDG